MIDCRNRPRNPWRAPPSPHLPRHPCRNGHQRDQQQCDGVEPSGIFHNPLRLDGGASGSGRLCRVRLDVGQSRGFGSAPNTVLPDIENGPALTNARFSAQGRTSRPPIRYVAGTEIKSGLRNRHLAAPEPRKVCTSTGDHRSAAPGRGESAKPFRIDNKQAAAVTSE